MNNEEIPTYTKLISSKIVENHTRKFKISDKFKSKGEFTTFKVFFLFLDCIRIRKPLHCEIPPAIPIHEDMRKEKKG